MGSKVTFLCGCGCGSSITKPQWRVRSQIQEHHYVNRQHFFDHRREKKLHHIFNRYRTITRLLTNQDNLT